MKLLLHLLILLVPFLGWSQEIERILISGVIKAPVGEDVEAISIYNTSSENGTVSNAAGEFKIAVAVNDRVQITAVQYKSFTIAITQDDVASKTLSVYLNPYVNKLEEVLLRTTDLTGFASLDAKNIKTFVYNPELDLSLDAVRFGYDFQRDQYSGIEGNAAEEALRVSTGPIFSVDIGELTKLLFPRRRKTPVEITNLKQRTVNELWSRYTKEYLRETFHIPEEKVVDFVDYIGENGLTLELLDRQNEIRLLAFLFEQSDAYKKQLAIRD